MTKDRQHSYVLGEARLLTSEELALLERLLLAAGQTENLKSLAAAQVQNMNDGAMGSLRFVTASSSARRFGGSISQAEFIDQDGVPVSVALIVDQDGNLFELDLFKANFAPLVVIPPAESVKIIPI